MKKIKWDKDGSYTYAGIAMLTETGQYAVIYRDGRGINLVTPFDESSFTQIGMPRNRRFEFVEKGSVLRLDSFHS